MHYQQPNKIRVTIKIILTKNNEPEIHDLKFPSLEDLARGKLYDWRCKLHFRLFCPFPIFGTLHQHCSCVSVVLYHRIAGFSARGFHGVAALHREELSLPVAQHQLLCLDDRLNLLSDWLDRLPSDGQQNRPGQPVFHYRFCLHLPLSILEDGKDADPIRQKHEIMLRGRCSWIPSGPPCRFGRMDVLHRHFCA